MAEGKPPKEPPRPDADGRFDQPFRRQALVRLPKTEAQPQPPPPPKRAPALAQTLPGSPAPPSGKPPRVIEAVFEDESTPPGPPRDSWTEERTGRGVPHPPGKHPPRSTSPPPFELAESPSAVHSSREGAFKALLEKAERERDEARDAALRAQFEAQQPKIPSVPPKPPSLSVSFGAAKWWTLVLAALAGVFHEMPKGLEALGKFLGTPSHEQLDALSKRIDDNADVDKKRQEANDKAQSATAAQALIVEAWLCSQGLKADGLDCDIALARAKFEAQPLTGNKVRGAPQWRTRLIWPPARAPPEP